MSSSMTPEQAIDFLILVMSHSTNFAPDYKVVSTAAGINTAGNAQRRFKSIVEKSGRFKLDGKLITEKNATTGSIASPAVKESKSTKKAPPGPASTPSKKRKIVPAEDDAHDSDEIED